MGWRQTPHPRPFSLTGRGEIRKKASQYGIFLHASQRSLWAGQVRSVVRAFSSEDRDGRAGHARPSGRADGVRAQLRHLHLRGRRFDPRQDFADRGRRAAALRLPGGLASDVRWRDCRRFAPYLAEAWLQGIENIVALRGDPPRGETKFCQTAGGFCYANELVAMIRGEFPQFGIAVAGYPETHQEARSPEHDLANLKRKVDAGASVVITQLFYDNADFFRFRDRARAVGVMAPIVPGILPVTNLAQIQRITSLCKARLPDELVDSLSQAGEDEAGQFEAGVEFATRQVSELIEAGVPGVHFYVLNKSPAAVRVLRGVGHSAGS